MDINNLIDPRVEQLFELVKDISFRPYKGDMENKTGVSYTCNFGIPVPFYIEDQVVREKYSAGTRIVVAEAWNMVEAKALEIDEIVEWDDALPADMAEESMRFIDDILSNQVPYRGILNPKENDAWLGKNGVVVEICFSIHMEHYLGDRLAYPGMAYFVQTRKLVSDGNNGYVAKEVIDTQHDRTRRDQLNKN